jgi:hypothetical protein
VAGALAVVYLASAAIFLVDRSWGSGLVAGGLAVVTGLLTLPAMHAASVLGRFPPPPDLNDATPEFMERYRKEREERRKKYNM